jgi:hypothetical protein
MFQRRPAASLTGTSGAVRPPSNRKG